MLFCRSFPGEEGRDAVHPITRRVRKDSRPRAGGAAGLTRIRGWISPVGPLARNAEGTTLQLAEDERVDAGYAPFLENFKSPTAQRVEGMRYFCPSQRRVGHKCSLL